ALTQGISDAWREFGEGGWQSTKSGFQLTLPRDSMVIAGSTQWTDYFVEVEVDIDGRMGPGSASLLFRATHPSYYPEQVRDSVVAYAVTLRQDRILLQKLNYGSTLLASAVIDPGSAHTLAVEAKGPSLKVYLDNLETPILEYTDPDAWMHGAVGLRTNTTRVAFRNLRLYSLPDPHRDDTEARPKLTRSPSTLHNPAP